MNASLIHALRQRRDRFTAMIAADREAARNAGNRLTRRRFIQTTGGSIVAGAALGAQLLRPSKLYAAGDDPLPVPENPAFSPFRIYAPAPAGFPGLDSIDAEPATITNFNGVVGLAYIDGTVTRTSISTGDTIDLPFLFSDMRFMNGVYRGVDGKSRQGTFALI